MSQLNIYDNGTCQLENMCMYAGDSKNIEVDLEIEDEQNNPTTLESITVKMLICDLYDESHVLLEKTAILNRDGGIHEIFLSTQDTIKISIGKYKYVLQMIYDTGEMNIGKGYLTIL